MSYYWLQVWTFSLVLLFRMTDFCLRCFKSLSTFFYEFLSIAPNFKANVDKEELCLCCEAQNAAVFSLLLEVLLVGEHSPTCSVFEI